MSGSDVLEMFGNVKEYIDSHLDIFWKKYVQGVNMSWISCTQLQHTSPLPDVSNKFAIYVDNKRASIDLIK